MVRNQTLKEERTFVLIKPDGVARGLVGEIISRFEKRGLRIVAMKMLRASREQVDRHYPKKRAWVTNLGQNLLRTGQEFNIKIDLQKEYGTANVYQLGKMVRGWLVEQLSSGSVVIMIIEGPHAIRMVRKIVGPTIPAFAEMGTIRGDFSVDSPALANPEKRAINNLIHASGDPKEARHEIKLWFGLK